MDAPTDNNAAATDADERNSFKSIEFGFSDAHTEGTSNPQLLLDAFLDEDGWIDDAINGDPFLFLGYKGSGKSAIAERARLLATSEPNTFVTVKNLEQFRYGDFKATAGTGEPQTRYPTVWAWLLLVSLYESLESDEGGKSTANAEYKAAAGGLRDLGLIPGTELNVLVTKSKHKSLKVSLPKFFSLTHERTAVPQDLHLSQAVTTLSEAAGTFPTQSRHVIFLDGLDELLGQRDLQFQTLAALMLATKKLNARFKELNKPFKFVVLCRTDIFERLPGANMNKFRQDHAVSLNWYDDPAHPDTTRLIKLINLRARTSLGQEDVNVFSEFFPQRIKRKSSRKAVLDHTRHTPRDVVTLMRYLQKHAHADSGITPNQILSGLRSYSLEYFLLEIQNELYGYLGEGEVHAIEQLLREHGEQNFTVQQIEQLQDELRVSPSLDLNTAVEALFDCSAIGLVELRNGINYRTVKYRNRNAKVSLRKTMWVHPTLCKALGISPSPGMPLTPVPGSQKSLRSAPTRKRRYSRGR